ncbi:MAG: asparagine synthase (glutamine-hydrolyzing) [Planctomycetes bacterium]|nr:asparagine synthase (glutamine-hydrolyzing) [Planctomycetota bacterium]
MCGIVGTLVLDGSDFAVSEPYLCRMRDTMTHRGPDGQGTWISENRRVGLGHRRLAIIDLSAAAAQPMSHANGRYQITFNGEIYNHAEIRRELEQLGHHHWQTGHSDTEVILQAFAEWGIDCLHRFRGMFAFALWDDRERELWLVRDRIGIKPLYFSRHHGRLVFASEIKALLQDPDQSRAVDEEALFHYLSFLTTPAPMTLFAGIQKLPPATWMCIRPNGDVRQQRYWDVWDHTEPLVGVSEDEIAERLLDSLRTAVRYRGVGDVPVGVFLSGGIDSATNAALFSENLREPLQTFTIGYEDSCLSNPSEVPFARRIAAMFGAKSHEHLLTQDDLLQFLPRMVELQDEPIADPVCVPVYYVSRLAREAGVIVCQVGEGADELFCGYPGWMRMLRLQRNLDRPFGGIAARIAGWGLSLTGRGHSWPAEKLRRAANGLPVFWGGAEAFGENQKRTLLSPRLRSRFADTSSWDVLAPIRRNFEEKAWDPSALNWMSDLDINFRLPELLLMRVDKMSMGVSLEARVPFLDHEFITLAMSIPAEMKIRGGRLKHILKKSVRGLIPDEIIDRKKQGFGVPVHEWIDDGLGKTMQRELDSFCDRTDFLDRTAVENVVAAGGQAAWYLFNLALWWKHYIAGEEIGGMTTNSLRRTAA